MVDIENQTSLNSAHKFCDSLTNTHLLYNKKTILHALFLCHAVSGTSNLSQLSRKRFYLFIIKQSLNATFSWCHKTLIIWSSFTKSLISFLAWLIDKTILILHLARNNISNFIHLYAHIQTQNPYSSIFICPFLFCFLIILNKVKHISLKKFSTCLFFCFTVKHFTYVKKIENSESQYLLEKM